ncbi:beta-ketoacyl synthase chain length factor [Myroides odoratus]|uniref:beta-ketoacyl synthase chain length factor n=1 Tax=Myroides odoratus TaxID=256 RepID=UPI0039AED6D7
MYNKEDEVYHIVEPDYYEYLTTHIVRRGSRSAKFGMYAALKCVNKKNIELLDGILVATSLGGLKNSEDFMIQSIDNEESNLSPNYFIQSLHSTLSGNMAIELCVKAYNITYTNRGNAFEMALLDASMLFNEGSKDLLIGASDEVSDNYKKAVIKDCFLGESLGKPYQFGEGASFFRLSKVRTKDAVSIIGVKTFYKLVDNNTFSEKIFDLLNEKEMTIEDIDILISGVTNVSWFKKKSNISPIILYKDFVGEYPTSISFAVWLGEQIIKEQSIPSLFSIEGLELVKTIMVINKYKEYESVIILSKN